jgi:hypothetical protein
MVMTEMNHLKFRDDREERTPPRPVPSHGMPWEPGERPPTLVLTSNHRPAELSMPSYVVAVRLTATKGVRS